MAMVQRGGSRQDVHEVIRKHSMAASYQVKARGRENDLLDRIKSDEYFAPIHDCLEDLLRPSSFIGRAPEQVAAFLEEEAEPAIAKWRKQAAPERELSV
jgi:adenylosuccinate lyase